VNFENRVISVKILHRKKLTNTFISQKKNTRKDV